MNLSLDLAFTAEMSTWRSEQRIKCPFVIILVLEYCHVTRLLSMTPPQLT